MRILVADDDEAIRVLVIRLFTRRGDSVQGAADGTDAIACLDAEDFDLLILDLMMPRTDGLGVLRYLRERPKPPPPVVVMTAAAPSLVSSVPGEQVAATVTKPFDISSLLRIADEAVRDRAQGSAAPGPPRGAG